MERGKNINVYLMDGNPSGRIKCTIANWTGIIYKIPRTDIAKCKGKTEWDTLNQSGVYFLFGVDSCNKATVYIGQAGIRKNSKGMIQRIQESHPTIDYWTEAIMITVQNNSFGPTEISFLENKFCNLATEANRYIVKNGNDPNPGNITEEKESELLDFVDYSKIVMGTLGHRIFDPVTEKHSDEPFFYTSRNGIKATGQRTNDGFVVLRNSNISLTEVPSCPSSVSKMRKQCKDIIKNGILTEDKLFNSPSTAAAFVVGGSVNGMIEWKDKNNQTLKDFEGFK